MKKYFLLLLIPVFVASSCGREAKKKAEELQARTDSLMNQTMQKDEAINEFVRSINDIQSTLDTIKMKENVINLSTERGGELKQTAKDQIKTDIQTIYSMMLKNKYQLAKLSKKLKAANMKVDELQKMVSRLEQDVTSKTAQLADLRDKLAKMNIKFEDASLKIDTLTKTVAQQGEKINDQTQTIAAQEEALNTAYYVIGTSKDLKKNGVDRSYVYVRLCPFKFRLCHDLVLP